MVAGTDNLSDNFTSLDKYRYLLKWSYSNILMSNIILAEMINLRTNLPNRKFSIFIIYFQVCLDKLMDPYQ